MEMKLPQPEPFGNTLARGKVGESQLARWMIARGQNVMPVYELELETGKGPRFFTQNGQLVAPDMFIMPAMIWIEAKHKSVFSWYRISTRWVTGIDINHYDDYRKVEVKSSRPVWLLFLHTKSKPDAKDIKYDCPATCPTGLFGERLSLLAENESHRHSNWGPSGMVYWAVPPLRQLATYEEVVEAAQQ
jgi:hypothetical protein